jgi:hypothetical protein
MFVDTRIQSDKAAGTEYLPTHTHPQIFTSMYFFVSHCLRHYLLIAKKKEEKKDKLSSRQVG